MTESDILTHLLAREGTFRAAVRRPNGTMDPDTMYGITAITLGAYRGLGRPATRDEVKALKEPEARAIYRKQYILAPGFLPAAITYEPLRIQCIDFGINSGQARAIRWLQRVLRVPVTSVLDLATRNALTLHAGHLVNDALVAARSWMIDTATDNGSIRREDEEGLESRALSFFGSKP